jgi:glucose-6-phosphate 1-dehydrogenase
MKARRRGSAQSSAEAPQAPGCLMVIFGAGGDLAKRLLIPALYNLTSQGLLGEDFKVLGVDRNDRDEAAFRSGLGHFIAELAEAKTSEFGAEKIDPIAWKHLSDRLFYEIGDFEDDAAYQRLAARIASLGGPGVSVLFYLAVAPHFFGDIVERLAKSGLTRERRGAYRRVVIEKPFGTDLGSARALNRKILKHLDEPQIYRIDHFMGKETVRNVMATRFANGVFEPLWNRNHIDHVQITAAETIGVEDRGAYYDHAGALRDMIPNHLFQLLAMTAMEAPNTLDAAAISAERTRVIEAVQIPSRAEALADAVRGQYRPGTVLGRPMMDYRREPHVGRRSRTETFVALKLSIDNQRWAGVPFYLRTGKAMRGRDTEVAIRFKPTSGGLFRTESGASPQANTLVLQIQPQEGISLHFEAKRPGPVVHLSPVQMDFCYASAFGQAPSTGYETLIYDCLIGDRTLFKSAEEIEYGWRAVQPFLDAWRDAGQVHGYAAGSDGPHQAEALLQRDGRSWRPVAA